MPPTPRRARRRSPAFLAEGGVTAKGRGGGIVCTSFSHCHSHGSEATIFVPQGGTKITTLFQAVERAFGSFDSLRKHPFECFFFAYFFFRSTMAMKFRYLPPPASMDLRSPTAYSLSWASQSAHTSSLLSISRMDSTSAPRHWDTMPLQ